jgi:hypothetical protein
MNWQESLGLDIICEGEFSRSVDRLHPFYNHAYIYYFAQFLDGVHVEFNNSKDDKIIIKGKLKL